MPKHDLLGKLISYIVSWFSLSIAWIFLPIASLYVIAVPEEKMRDQDFKDRWGQLYSNMDENQIERAPSTFYFVFIVLRNIFIHMSI